MRVIVLGAAAGGGYPQWNCKCAVCALAWAQDPRVRAATQSSIAVSATGRDWVLLNASPDLGAQIVRSPALWPREVRSSSINAVVLTSADIDHIGGLLTLREQASIPIYALQPVHAALERNPVFSALRGPRVRALANEPSEIAGLSIELFPVAGKVPLYLENDSVNPASTAGETAGVMVRSGRSRFAYVPACAALTNELEQALSAADAILFDGTLFTDDEMIVAGLGEKTGRRMGHMPISGEGGSLAFLSGLPARQKVYVHLNNTNPAWIAGSSEREAIERAGLQVGFDRMEISL